MTRGKIIYIDAGGNLYSTAEFNGDMYPDGNASEVLDRFEEGYFSSYWCFCKFVLKFKDKHEYEDDSVEHIHKDNCVISIKDNWTDYLYIINESEKEWLIVDGQDNHAFLSPRSLAIIHFMEVDRVLHRIIHEEVPRKENTLALKEFVSIIDSLRVSSDLVDNVNELFRKSRENIGNDFCDGAALQISHESTVIRLLKLIMNDKNSWIEYFIYELDYGRKYKSGMIWDEEGKNIDLSSSEKLYEYILINR